jgi:hypothetical protein
MNIRFILAGAMALGSLAGLGGNAMGCDELKSAAASELTLLGSVAGSKTIEVTIENGKASAKVDGKEIPSDRIKAEKSGIVILDEKGEVLHEVPMSVDSSGYMKLMIGDEPFEMHVGDADAHAAMIKRYIESAQPRFQGAIRALRNPGAAPSAPGIDEGEPPKVMIGVALGSPDQALAKHLKLKPNEVTLLSEVYEDLPAAEAGLEQFDIIVEVDGHAPAGPDAVRGALKAKNPGDTLKLTILRGSEKKTVTVDVEAFDAEKLGEMAPPLPTDPFGSPFFYSQTRPLRPHQAPLPPGAPQPPAPPQGAAPPDMQDLILQMDPQWFSGQVFEGNDEMEKRLDQMDQRLEAMAKRLEELMEKLEKKSG